MTTTHDHLPSYASARRQPASAGEWMTYDEGVDYPTREPDIVAQFTAPTGVEVQLINLSHSSEAPDIAVVYGSPRVSRGRSPAGTLLSPLELFLAFETGDRTPEVLVRHHRALAGRGVFAPQPRALPLPLWAGRNPDLSTIRTGVWICGAHDNDDRAAYCCGLSSGVPPTWPMSAW